MCYVLSKATDRQPGFLNPGFPRPIRKMRPFRYRFATKFQNANFNMHFINNLRISPRKTVHFYAPPCPNESKRIRAVLPGCGISLSWSGENRTKPDISGRKGEGVIRVRNRTPLPGPLQGKQNETKRDDFTISSHFNIAVPGTYDDSSPRCLVFCSAASERNRTNPNAFAAIRAFRFFTLHSALCTLHSKTHPK